MTFLDTFLPILGAGIALFVCGLLRLLYTLAADMVTAIRGR